MSAKAGAGDVDEVKSIPGNRAGNDNAHDSLASDGPPGPAKMAEPGGLNHSLHASERRSATAATETAEAKATPGNRAGNDNAHDSLASDGPPGPAKMAAPDSFDHSLYASERRSATAATGTAEVKSIPGNRTGNDNGHDSLASDGSSEPAKMAEPGGLDHSLHASERRSAMAATETAEVKSIPGNRTGNDNGHDSLASDGSSEPAKTAEPGGLDNSNLHASERRSATAAAETAETRSVPGNGVGSDNEHHSWTSSDMPGPGRADGRTTQHPAEPEPGKTEATTELAETDFISGKGVGNGNDRAPDASASAAVTTANLADLQHGNSEPNLPSISVDTSAATEIDESVATKGESAGNGNSQHATQPAAIALVAAQPAKAAFETGADQEWVFRFDSDATPITLIVRVESKEVHIPLDPHDQPGQAANPDILVKILPTTLDEHVANHGHNGQHHVSVLAPHDLLI
jgi:hypothetical protein